MLHKSEKRKACVSENKALLIIVTKLRGLGDSLPLTLNYTDC